MFTTNIYLIDGVWKTKAVKKGDASYVALFGPSGTVRIHLPHADARALEAAARVLAFAIRQNDGTSRVTTGGDSGNPDRS